MVRSGGTGLSLVVKVCEAGEDIRSSPAKYLGLAEVFQELLGVEKGAISMPARPISQGK